jgi:uncharacterized protein YlaN (UPF0358 family)
MTHHDEELHWKAVELVREAYDMADKMRKVNLDALNEPRPPTMRYHVQYEVVMAFLNRAGAMLEFAGQLGLIDSEENGEILRSISPELTQWLEDEDKRLESEA